MNPAKIIKTIKHFDNFPDAFEYCRECDKPITAMVNNEKWKLYPSGIAKRIKA